MRNIKSNYQILFVGLLLVVFIFFAVISGLFIKYYLEDNLQQRLSSEMNLVQRIFENEAITETEKIEIVKEQSLYDITILSNYNEPFTTVEIEKEHFLSNLVFYVEKSTASKFKVGDKYSVLYQVIQLENRQVVLTTKVLTLKDLSWKIIIFSIISFSLLFAFTLILTIRFYSEIDKTITDAILVTDSFLKGDLKARMSFSPFRKTNELAFSVNELAISMQREKKKQTLLNDRLSALVENIGSSVFVIEKDGKINFVNKTFSKNFKMTKEECMDHYYYEVITFPDVIEIVELVFLQEKNVKKQLAIQLNGVQKYFQVYGVPVISKKGLWEGIVLVFHDITELKKLEKMRKDFVANVSHELRTPITSIKGFTETLIDGAKNDPDTLESFLQIIYKESDRLQVLVQDLLELSRIETNKLELNFSKVLLNDLIDECLFLIELKTKEKNIKTQFNQNEIIMIEADYNRLKQVIVNLLTNAVNYSKDDGTIIVELKRKDKEVMIVIKDTGIGMEETELPRIFERFYRIDRARNRDSGGTGLGLSIVKHLIEAHHGEIQVQSKLDVGTTFTITLPITIN